MRVRARKSAKWRKWRLIWLTSLLLVWLFCTGAAHAGVLADRIAQFPNLQEKFPLPAASGDLTYPEWFSGTWDVTTTLVDLAAPLAPDVVTPGFESNRDYLNQPVPFQARFLPQPRSAASGFPLLTFNPLQEPAPIIADRAFNGLNLARAYLDSATPAGGKSWVQTVKVDPTNPNRQITLLRGDRQLVSTISARATETPSSEQFITTEVFQQEFRGTPQLYFNRVETTTAYQQHPDKSPAITADQVTAIYLSPQDPDYFKANGKPVALYRYRLEFVPAEAA